MPRPSGDQRLLPSVLDRMLDDQPQVTRDPEDAPSRLLAQVKDAVKRDLEWLLNSKQVVADLPDDLRQIRQSLLTYGMPDFTAANLSNNNDQSLLRRAVEEAVKRFEPRLTRVVVSLEAGRETERALHFRIDALLKVDPEPEPVTFDSVLQLSNKAFVVKGEETMIEELLAYYNAELAYLREMGAEFAERYPKVAARLLLEADKCEDPHVERILEGVAFLTARIRHKIDDEFPEITDALLGLLYPHLQRPLPSMAIVQFLHDGKQIKREQGFTVERGSRLNSRPVGGTPCKFRTAYPVTLWPIEVAAARLDPDRVVVAGKPPEAVALLQLSLRGTGGASFSQLGLERLRFYLDGTGPLPYSLYELLCNNVCRIVIRAPGGGPQSPTLTLSPTALEPVGFGRDEGMFDYPSRAFPGYRLFPEYFTLPEKFLFFDLGGLKGLRERGFGEAIDILFFLNRSPRGDLIVQPENFRLGCTPAVNLFTTVAEPIALTQTQYEYRVVPDVHRPLATEVYSVDRVTSAGGFLREPVVYEPFYSVRHGGSERKQAAYWYATRRPSARKDDPGTEVDLAFADHGFNPRLPACETITVHATCTNRDLPGRLPFGGEQGDFELEAPGPVSRVRCLRKPTRPVRPPLKRGAQWRLISQLSLNHLSLADSEQGLDALREVLAVHDFAESAVTRQQISGITGVSSRRTTGRTGRKIGNAVSVGIEVTVEFDENHYVGGGAYLMASVLERFLGLYASINSFSQLVARTKQREGILKRWPPRAGERTLL